MFLLLITFCFVSKHTFLVDLASQPFILFNLCISCQEVQWQVRLLFDTHQSYKHSCWIFS